VTSESGVPWSIVDAVRHVALGLGFGSLFLLGCPAGDDDSADTDAAGTTETAASSGDDGDDGGPGPSTSPPTTATAGPTTDAMTTGPGDTTSPGDDTTTGDPIVPDECTADEVLLVDLVNEYRADNGLPAIPLSPSLCIVGHTHAEDLQINNPHAPEACNLHSWSDAGTWTPCCYTPDHAQAECMWQKPAELTSYPGVGYENAAGGGFGPIGAAEALELWKGSPGHNAVILNLDSWADHPWGALGAGMYEGYAVLWFGEEADPLAP
jgi:uncharacterized protein YkwD